MRPAWSAVDEPEIALLPPSPRLQRVAGGVMRRVGLNDLVGIGAFSVRKLPDIVGADVVHLHLLEGNYFSYPAIAGLSSAKATVITLHDMWQLTGHCSYS